MAKQIVILTIKDGAVQNSAPLVGMIKSLKDGRYQVEVSKLNKRSNQQNRYYFGVLVAMVQQGLNDIGTEVTKEETHEFLKARFNYTEIVNTETGEVMQVPRSTTDLSKEQFSEYKDKIQRWAAEWLNIVIPDPGELLTMDF
jgi:hypothetical protein